MLLHFVGVLRDVVEKAQGGLGFEPREDLASEVMIWRLARAQWMVPRIAPHAELGVRHTFDSHCGIVPLRLHRLARRPSGKATVPISDVELAEQHAAGGRLEDDDIEPIDKQ